MKSIVSFLIVFVTLLSSCQQPPVSQEPAIKKGMIKVTVFYPNEEGKTFDMDYYLNKHMPLVKSLLGDSVKVIQVDKGLAGGAPDAPILYVAIGYLYFDTMSAYQNSIAPHLEALRNDRVNYTEIVPVVQVSEVLQ